MAKVLIVDDEKNVRELIAVALKGAGYQVVSAADGDIALARLQSESFDLVLLDIIMPEREGIETLREIRKSWPSLPVLMISGGDRTGWTDALRLAESLGATDTLPKPFRVNEWLERVQRLLAQTN